MAEEGAEETNSLEQLKRSMQYALIKNCDMNEEMRSDAVDLVISATEKYQANYELAARMVKDQVRTPSWDERRHRAPRIFCGSVCALALVPLSPAARMGLEREADAPTLSACKRTARLAPLPPPFDHSRISFPPLSFAWHLRALVSRISYLADGQEVQLELDRGDRAGLLV